MQANVEVTDNAITGTLHFIEGGLAPSGPLAGDGNFLALKFSATNWNAYDTAKVGLVPSASGMDLVDIKSDPDKNGVFKIAGMVGDTPQRFKVELTKDGVVQTKIYDLSGLVLEDDSV